MAAGTTTAAGRPRPAGDRVSDWRLGQRLAFLTCWACGIALCLVAGAIVVYMAAKGAQYLHPKLLFERPQPGLSERQAGGILDPVAGTLILTVLATAIALPIGVAAATWVVEYGQGGRAGVLARAVESGIEVVAGTPDIVLAFFGLAIFQLPILAPLSFKASGGGVFGRSFFAAAAMLSLIALPLIFSATREALMALPASLREGSWALGKTKVCTVRTILLPQIRRHIASGVTLGMGRLVGDTAIVLILLGGTLQLEPNGHVPILGALRGTGSTLTTYVYNASPAGEGTAPQLAYAAAFVLMLLVLLLNGAVDLIARRDPHDRLTR